MARRGRCTATELDEAQIEALRESAQDHGLDNVVIVRGSEGATNLPVRCCDVIFMSKVYHHFTQPREMAAGLYEALKPEGRLAIIDFEPRWWRLWLPLPAGVPRNRGGHGMPIAVLVEELGFKRIRGAALPRVHQLLEDGYLCRYL